MVECQYTLEIPKNRVEEYRDSVLIRIHGFTIKEIPRILGGLLESIENVTEKPDKYIYKFTQSNVIPLCNILPRVKITNLTTSFNDEEILQKVQKHICKCVHDYYFTDNAVNFELKTEYELGITDLENLVCQLTKEQSIKKFYPIRDDIYLICTRLPLLFEIGLDENSKFYIEKPHLIVFDIDDGFFGISSKYIKRLNKAFYEWEDKKDIKLPILPDIEI